VLQLSWLTQTPAPPAARSSLIWSISSPRRTAEFEAMGALSGSGWFLHPVAENGVATSATVSMYALRSQTFTPPTHNA
jgi:hypothetical protein